MISPLYALRETGQNLVRNFMLSFATRHDHHDRRVALALRRLFLFNYAVDNATARWEGGIEFVVWMDPDASPEQDTNIRNSLENPGIASWVYSIRKPRSRSSSRCSPTLPRWSRW